MPHYRQGLSSLSLSSAPIYANSRRIPSVYGAQNARMSYSTTSLGSGLDLSGALAGVGGGSGGIVLSGQEKMTMQNLNDRLAAYLEKVRSLEAANAKLELQIREWYEKQTPTVRDYSKYQAVIDDLRRKISLATQDNARLMLQIDNARLAAEDFRIKYENELAVRMSVEGDIAGLRKVLDELTTARSDLEMQVEGLKEELVYLKKNHPEEMAALRNQVTANSVNVEVETRPQTDMAAVLGQMRSKYEGIADKNRKEMEAWYKGKFDELSKQVASSTEVLQSSKTEISELNRAIQALQIELQSQLSLKSALEGQLAETESRFCLEMNQCQSCVNCREAELSQIKANIDLKSTEYQVLLDIKTRLELEIAEYRRLLDGEEIKKSAIPDEVKRQPVKTQRTKVVIEEIVDGQVVNRTEDVNTEVIN